MSIFIALKRQRSFLLHVCCDDIDLALYALFSSSLLRKICKRKHLRSSNFNVLAYKNKHSVAVLIFIYRSEKIYELNFAPMFILSANLFCAKSANASICEVQILTYSHIKTSTALLCLFLYIGVRRFELPASWSRTNTPSFFDHFC